MDEKPHPRSKLTWVEIDQIRRMAHTGELIARDLPEVAAGYDVSVSVMRNYLSYDYTQKHSPPDDLPPPIYYHQLNKGPCHVCGAEVGRRAGGTCRRPLCPTCHVLTSRRDYGDSWEEQRVKTLTRDNYTCQHCGEQQPEGKRSLHVHHITPFMQYQYRRGENDNDVLANQLSNLITLCGSCHKTAEHYGVEGKSADTA